MSLQVGGAIRSGALYVERAVDHQLLQHTLAGELCYILASRQIGKSSLRAHAALALHAAGCRVASVDLSMFGTVDLSAESFFLGVLTEIGADLGEDVDALWADHHRLPPAARWQRCLQALSVDRDCALVVFLDEIDGMRRIPQLGADLFATIRAATDRAALDARWKKLTFVLLGAATPAELIQDPLRTPFNVGRALEITDFTATEARALLPFLEELRPGSAPDLLQQILAWTSGHPYQTARVAAFLAEHPSLTVDDAITRLGAGKDGSLEAAAALLRATPALLLAYRQVLAGQALPHDPLLPELLLTGLVAIRDGVVCPRNRITTTLYGVPWVASQLGRRQLRTQTDVWIAGGRKRQHLPDAATLARLQQTLTSQENLERDEQEFLLVATEELRNRRLRRFVAALAVFVVVALVVAGLQWDRAEAERRERDRTRAELGLLEEARQAGQEVDRALLPGEQILALERVLNAQARLQGTPLENLATHDLAEVLEM
ncbi:MAG TPA: AAA-like domain-containing protein [Myxococcota bacterium]|nr:AAA-like domain-containing protein [Myxococcota bacterium]